VRGKADGARPLTVIALVSAIVTPRSWAVRRGLT